MPWITIPDLGQYGVVNDITPAELPINALSDALNVRFRDNYAERFEGQENLFAAPSVTPYHIAAYRTVGRQWWIHSGISQMFADDGVGRDEITPTLAPTGTVDDRFTGGALNGVFLLNNGVDVPWYWTGSGLLTPLTAWPSGVRAAVLRPWKNYVMLLDVTEGGTRYPHRVRWSAEADPGTIPASYDIADPTLDAGEIDLAETPGLMVDCLPLGNANIIYKEDAMYAQSFVGVPFIMAFQKLPDSVGLIARGCVVDTPVGHVLMTPGDVVRHSGQGVTSILDGTSRRTLFAQLDPTNYRRSFLVANRLKNEVWICYPEEGQTACTRALVWNWVNGTRTFRTLSNVTYGVTGPIVASTDTDKFLLEDGGYFLLSDGSKLILAQSANPQIQSIESRLVLCDTKPAITVADEGDTFDAAHLLNEDGGGFLLSDGGYLLLADGVAFSAYVERLDMTLGDGDGETQKTIKTIVPRIDAAAGTIVNIQVGGRNDVETDVTWGAAVAYEVGTSRKANFRQTWRYPAYRLSTDENIAWRLRSMDIEYVKGGLR